MSSHGSQINIIMRTMFTTHPSLVSETTHLLQKDSAMGPNDILHYFDTFTVGEIKKILSRNGSPKAILSDHYCVYKTAPDLNIISLPLWIAREIKLWEKNKFSDSAHIGTEQCFNFMVNKYKLHRNLMLKLIEAFDYRSYHYSYSGLKRNTDFDTVIEDANKLLSCEELAIFLQPVAISNRFFLDGARISTVDTTASDRVKYKGNKRAWDNDVKTNFQKSAVALVTETTENDSTDTENIIFTEKTIFALLGLNLPIWVGGHGYADFFASMGFDIFDDVINHAYQYKPTLFERCYYALTDNNKILTNIEYATDVRQRVMSRLIENRRQLIENNLLTNYIDKQISQLPVEMQKYVNDFVEYYLNTPSNMEVT